jgi:hypothetical protein
MSETRLDIVVGPDDEQVFSGNPEETYKWLTDRENHWAIGLNVRVGETNRMIPVTKYVNRGIKYEAVLLMIREAMSRHETLVAQHSDDANEELIELPKEVARKIMKIIPDE